MECVRFTHSILIGDMMEIAGFIVNSFVDYPGNIASVVFTPGCNMNCWYCHNRDIISETKGGYDEDKILSLISERKTFLDGVVITGGEPTLQKDLIAFIEKIKKLGLKVKLDTNGTNFSVVKKLVEEGLLDYIAMDIKAPFSKYNIVTIVKDIEEVKKTARYIMGCGVEYEFRTTFAPNLTDEDIVEICKELEGCENYALQGYQVPSYLDNNKVPPHKNSLFLDAQEKAKKYVKNFIIRNI